MPRHKTNNPAFFGGCTIQGITVIFVGEGNIHLSAGLTVWIFFVNCHFSFLLYRVHLFFMYWEMETTGFLFLIDYGYAGRAHHGCRRR